MHVQVNDIRVNYRIDGKEGAPWLTLVTGIANDLSMWDGQLPALGDFRVLRYDLRGQGGTRATTGPTRSSRWSTISPACGTRSRSAAAIWRASASAGRSCRRQRSITATASRASCPAAAARGWSRSSRPCGTG